MEQVFYYADLDLMVTLSQEKPEFLDKLTPNERMALQQHLYQSISCFLTVRALYRADCAEDKEPNSDED